MRLAALSIGIVGALGLFAAEARAGWVCVAAAPDFPRAEARLAVADDGKVTATQLVYTSLAARPPVAPGYAVALGGVSVLYGFAATPQPDGRTNLSMNDLTVIIPKVALPQRSAVKVSVVIGGWSGAGEAALLDDPSSAYTGMMRIKFQSNRPSAPGAPRLEPDDGRRLSLAAWQGDRAVVSILDGGRDDAVVSTVSVPLDSADRRGAAFHDALAAATAAAQAPAGNEACVADAAH